MCRIVNKCFYLLICFLLNTVCAVKPIVETTYGKVAGKEFKSLIKETPFYGFMGIPYAAPPVKELRFLSPQPVTPWLDVLQVTQNKPACVQYNINVRKGQPLGQYGAEDCLYLDIFTPSFTHNLPVIVFLYNEQFKSSYNKTKDYAPDFFIENEVIIATISHRLSIFGFMSFEDDILQGNSGLKDIVAGLEWIKNNLARFGGDASRITIMGSQGGAAAVDFLLHSNAKGLFSSVILQSGSSFSSLYLQDDSRKRVFALGEILKLTSYSNSTRLLQELNEVSTGELLTHEFETVDKDYSKEHQRGVHPFGPVIENDESGLLTDYPESCKSINVPVMIGFNSQEGMYDSLQYLLQPNIIGALNKDFTIVIPKRVNFRFEVDKKYDEAVDEVKKFYFQNGKVTVKNIAEYVTYAGDLKNSAVDFTAKFYSNISSKEVYYYHFDYYSDLNENKQSIMSLSTVPDGTYGAASGDELCYLFKCPNLKDKYMQFNNTMTEEMIIQKKLVTMWSNFAKYGNPTPQQDTTLDVIWPPYNTKTKKYLNIGKSIEVKKDLYNKRFEFWENFITKWESRAVDGIISDNNKKDEL